MRTENNGTYTYKGCTYILKYGHTEDSALVLLEAMERSKHLSECTFYRTSKLLSRHGLTVYDVIGIGNVGLYKILQTPGYGSVTADVLCELQRMEGQDENQIGVEREMLETNPFKPKPVSELVRQDEIADTCEKADDEVKANDIEITHGGMCVRLRIDCSNVTIRVSDGCIDISQGKR